MASGVDEAAAEQEIYRQNVEAIRVENRPADRQDEIFEQLYASYVRGVYHFFANRGFLPETCQDLTQETFLEVHKSLPRLRDTTGAKAWIFKIATHVWLNEMRRTHTFKRKGQDVSLDSLHGPTSPSRAEELCTPPQDQALLHEESLQLLRRELAKLPPQMRRCISLRLQDMKYQEIANALQLSVQTVKSQIHQAKARLKESRLAEYFTDWD